LARSTSRRPEGRISPAAISASALSRLTRDQGLFARRGVNRCSENASSNAAFWLSIQPKQRAASTASA
jgi:hypothetical protein